MNTLEIGKKGEELVAAHLARNGFTIIGRNYRQRQGEIDVIGRTGDLVVFVEVKLRQSNYFDQTTIITKSKQKK